jgi:hypothetical protein
MKQKLTKVRVASSGKSHTAAGIKYNLRTEMQEITNSISLALVWSFYAAIN